MDIIYHRNCLDGVYSAYLMYLLSHHITQQGLFKMKQAICQRKIEGYDHDIGNFIVEKKIQLNGIKKQINEKLFHQSGLVDFSSYGIYAGKFQEYYYSNKNHNKVLFILDNNCQSTKNIEKLSLKYQIIIIIDHHTTFKQTEEQIKALQLQKVYYIWKEGICASQLTLQFLNNFFNFSSVCLEQFYQKDLARIISFVGKNDLKIGQDKQSKMFVLGFYYFDIEMSHVNPWMFKRIGCLQLDYILQKGQNVYKNHFQCIQEQISRVSLAEIKGKFNQKCLVLSPKNPQLISDIGSVMAYLSRKNMGLNVGILYIPKGDYYRISCRSYRRYQDPLALEIAEKFNGGGHKEAAGARTTKQQFKSFVSVLGSPKFNTKLKIDEIQEIIFNKAPLTD